MPVGTSAGNIIITATTLNGKFGRKGVDGEAGDEDQGRDHGPATSLSLSSDAASISGTNSPDNGAEITITPKDKDGVRRNFTGVVIVTTDLGHFGNAPVEPKSIGDDDGDVGVPPSRCVRDDSGQSAVVSSSPALTDSTT